MLASSALSLCIIKLFFYMQERFLFSFPEGKRKEELVLLSM